MQAAESQKLIEKINAQLPVHKRIIFPEISHLSDQEKTKVINDWIEKMSDEHMLEVFENLTANLDAESTNVSDLLNYLSDHPDLFEYFLRIIFSFPTKKRK